MNLLIQSVPYRDAAQPEPAEQVSPSARERGFTQGRCKGLGLRTGVNRGPISEGHVESRLEFIRSGTRPSLLFTLNPYPKPSPKPWELNPLESGFRNWFRVSVRRSL